LDVVVIIATAIFGSNGVFSQEKKSSDIPPGGGPLSLTLSLDKNTCELGDYITAEVKLENISPKEQEISEFLFEKRSLRFRLTSIPEKGKSQESFLYSISNPESYIQSKLPLQQLKIPPKKSITNFFLIPAVVASKMYISAEFNGAEKLLVSNPVEVEVKLPTNASKLVAVLEYSGKAEVKKDEKENEIKEKETKEIKGEIVIDLLPHLAPNNVANFINLVRKGFYNDSLFFRVKKDFVLQTGCPYGTGVGGPGYSVESEIPPNSIKHDIGVVSFSQYEKEGSCGSQFFICLQKLPVLDGKFTVFGKITEPASLEKIKEIANVNVDSEDRPVLPIVVKKITIKCH